MKRLQRVEKNPMKNVSKKETIAVAALNIISEVVIKYILF